MNDCKKCHWYFVYTDWRYTGDRLWSKVKKQFIIPCHSGNQKGNCKNFEKKTPWWKLWK